MTKLDRRQFLTGTAAVAAAAAAGCLPDVDGKWEEQGATICSAPEPRVSVSSAGTDVVELQRPDLVSGLRINEAAAAPAMRELLLAIGGAPDARSACRAIIPGWAAGQIIGIKVNVLNDRVPTHPAFVRALVDLLKEGLGAGGEEIVVWDRRLDELADARFTAEAMGCAVEGTWESAAEAGGGRGYELGTVCIGGRKTHLSNLLTRRIDHLINFAVMKNHKASGFTGCLKNNYGLIQNPGDYHDNTREGVIIESRFDRAIPEINALPEVVGKTRLWITDATIGVCKGDTSDPPDCFPTRLLASRDPVAIDARGREIRDEQRGAELGPSPETISSSWLAAAERVGLGSASFTLKKIS